MSLDNSTKKSGHLDALTDVIFPAPANNGDVLTWVAPTTTAKGYWTNTTPASAPVPGILAGAGTIVAAAGAATLNTPSGTVTSEGLSTATSYVLTLANSKILAGSIVLVNVTESTGAALITLKSKVVTAGQVVVTVSMASLTGTLAFDFAVFN